MFKFPAKYHIALVAPAGGCSAETVAYGRQVLEKCGCKVTLMPHLFSGNSLPHLAADDAARADDINQALADENIDLLWAVRGGCGAMRILPEIDWQLWQTTDKPLLGFSDITALHWAMEKMGCRRFIAAPMMKFLAGNADEITVNSLFEALAGNPVNLRLPALKPGNICAPALPGNLAVAAAMCGTPYFPDTTGKVLILEEIGEAPYRIDRMLTQLRLAGAFDRCAGIVFGHFTDCGEMPGILPVLQDFADSAKCPVYYGLPFGHELPFYSLGSCQNISVSN